MTFPPRRHPVPAIPLAYSLKEKKKTIFPLKNNKNNKGQEKKEYSNEIGGEIAAETMKRKKGRPSLLELQKRSLKQHQQQQSLQQNPPNALNTISSINSSRRSARRNPNLHGGFPVPDWIAGGGGDDDDDDDDERQQKKHKLLLGLNSSRNHHHYPIPSAHNSASCASDSNADGGDPEASLKRRNVTTLSPGSDQMVISYP